MPFDLDPTPPDPFDRLDYMMNKPFRGLGLGRPAGPEYRRPFQPEEYESLRDKFLGGAMSGLRGVGWALSTPGDYLRGAVSGHLGERKSGRDILNQIGITRKGDEGWVPWGLGLAADIGTDPLNLLTLGPKHAFTLAGKALSKLGPTEGGIQGLSRLQRLQGLPELESGLTGTAEQIRHSMLQRPDKIATAVQEGQVAKELGRPLLANEPLASLAKIQLPFGIGPQLNIGTGPWAQKVAGRLDKMGDYLRFGNPIGRGIQSILSQDVQQTMGRTSQRAFALPGGGTDVAKAAEAAGQQRLWPIHQRVEELLKARPNDPAYEQELMRAIDAVAGQAPVSHYDPAILAQARPIGEDLYAQIYQKNLDIERARGSSTKEYISPWNQRYTHRQALHQAVGEPLERLRSMPAHMGYDIARNPNLAVPGGTDRVNLWVEQGLTNPGLPLQAVRMQVYKDSLKDLREIQGLGHYQGQVNPTAKMGLWNHAEDVATELRKMKGMAGPGKHDPLFVQDPIGLASAYLSRSAKKQGGLESIFRSIGETAVAAGTHPRGEAIPLGPFLRQLGLTNRVPATLADPITGGGIKALEALAPQGAPMASDLAKAYKSRQVAPGIFQPVPDVDPLNRALKQYEIPRAAAQEILASPRIGQMPEQLTGLAKAGASLTNLFRAMAYPIWPASHVRNIGTAAINLLRTDTPIGAIKSVIDQWKLGRNPNFADPAVSAARMNQFAHGGVFSGFGPQSEVAGMNIPQRLAAGERITPHLPGAYSMGPEGMSPTGTAIGDAANLMLNQGLLGTIKNIGTAGKEIIQNRGGVRDALSKYLGVKGVGGQTVDTLPAVASGWRFGQNIEDLFRGAQMRGLERQGFSPTMQGRETLKYQFDYGPHGFTPIERNILRQIFPFYGFMRKNIPLQLETLATRPGVIGAQTAPMMQSRTQKGDYIPQYLQGNVAVPAGAPVDGKQQFFSTFGLPAEEAFGKMQFNAGAPVQSALETARGFASNLNPAIKGPLEWMTNRQFFSGRQLSDLRPSPAVQAVADAVLGSEDPQRDQMLTQILMNLPTTRFLTTGQRLADPRKDWWQKALNLGTGIRVTDVDIDKQRAIETRDALQALMAAQPHMAKYTRYYPQPAAVAKGLITPQEIELNRMMATYQAQAARYAEEKKHQEAFNR